MVLQKFTNLKKKKINNNSYYNYNNLAIFNYEQNIKNEKKIPSRIITIPPPHMYLALIFLKRHQACFYNYTKYRETFCTYLFYSLEIEPAIS